jgi:hypothetical protein
MFDKVRALMMYDTRPFEHRFFKLISRCFPFLEELAVCNYQSQVEKQDSSITIIFPYLTDLNLKLAHMDYAEQFLVEKVVHVPRLLKLTIIYESLAMVTNNFTNDATRLHCSRLKILHTGGPFVQPENFRRYFPLL